MSGTHRFLRSLSIIETLAGHVPPDAWDSPSPCKEWSARQVAGHLVDGLHQIRHLLHTGQRLPPQTSPEELALGRPADELRQQRN
jgi:hypothetical protein